MRSVPCEVERAATRIVSGPANGTQQAASGKQQQAAKGSGLRPADQRDEDIAVLQIMALRAHFKASKKQPIIPIAPAERR